MASTRTTLDSITANLDESMGVRYADQPPRLSPTPQAKDAGRRPLRNVGQVDVNQVVADPDQPRMDFSEEPIDRLAQSIRDRGQLSAIRVRWNGELGKWVIIAGERRWRAAKRAGLSTIDCYFCEGDLSRAEVLEQQLVENCLREDLKPLEEAKAFAALMELNGYSGKQLAEALRLPPAKISRAAALLKLPADIQEQVNEGVIGPRAAYELAKLKDDRARRDLAVHVAAGRLTHDQTAKLVRQRRGRRAGKQRGVRQIFADQDGWKVVVSAGKKGTYHDIEKALAAALEEVRHRIRNNCQLF